MTSRQYIEMWFTDRYPELASFAEWLTDEVLLWEILNPEDNYVEQVSH